MFVGKNMIGLKANSLKKGKGGEVKGGGGYNSIVYKGISKSIIYTGINKSIVYTNTCDRN